ncbi:MAG: ATP-binding protein [Thermoanaerobaculum sp.]|nr:ATP-binding protein [Thermoanaerobaculum sp.]
MKGRSPDPNADAVRGGRLETKRVARWLLGIRILAIGAVIVTALVLQSLSEELLPLQPLFIVAGWGFALSLLWIALWLAGLNPYLHGLFQLIGDVVLVTTVVYFTGGAWSPFAFLLLAPVLLAALMYGLKGSLALAAAAFLAYLTMVQLVVFEVLPPPASISAFASPRPPSLTFQLALTAAGFTAVALLASYLAHSLQRAEQSLEAERAAAARAMALTVDVLRSVESGVLACDLAGRVLLANPAACAITGLHPPLEGKPIGEVLPLAGVAWDEVLARVALGFGQKLEGTITSSLRPLGCTVTPLASHTGEVLGAVAHFRDLTEAQEVARKEKLRERMVAAGEMAAGIAHEIRNPLASISGAAQVLATRTGLSDEERRLLRIVVNESRRLSNIIESFLNYARPPEPRWGPCQIASVLEETLDLFAHSSEVGPHHRILRHIIPHPKAVIADEQQLRQAFFNLARNAMQAMPDGGALTVEAFPQETNYVIRFRDEGEGMDPQRLDEIFQPFKAFRRGGTGLGLAVVYSIVSEHGGEVKVDSQPGEGSTFTLTLPMREA